MEYIYKDKNGNTHKFPSPKDYFMHHRHSNKKWIKPKPTTDETLNANKNFDTVFHNNSDKNSRSSNNSDDSDNVRLKRKKKLLNKHGFSR